MDGFFSLGRIDQNGWFITIINGTPLKKTDDLGENFLFSEASIYSVYSIFIRSFLKWPWPT